MLPIVIGPHVPSQRLVDEAIPGKVPGVYALSAKEGGAVNLRRVGRADDDHAMALRESIGLCSLLLRRGRIARTAVTWAAPFADNDRLSHR